jgi:hypothetical protein
MYSGCGFAWIYARWRTASHYQPVRHQPGVRLVSMTNRADSFDMRRYALAGARARLAEMSQEAEAIRQAFPELREGNGRRSGYKGSNQSGDDEFPTQTAGRRRGMSAAQRKAVGDRMKKYWAARKAASEGSSGSSDTSNATSPRTAKRGIRRVAKATSGSSQLPRRTMSAAGRKRISDAQKKRWAARRKGASAS